MKLLGYMYDKLGSLDWEQLKKKEMAGVINYRRWG